MKNYVIRNGIYYFRLAVPKGCQSEVGKREILQSLKTSDELEAAVAVGKLTKTWKIKFKAIRQGSKDVNAAGSRNETSASLVGPFKQQLSDYVQANVPHYLPSTFIHLEIEMAE
jgi:hypothetical protein